MERGKCSPLRPMLIVIKCDSVDLPTRKDVKIGGALGQPTHKLAGCLRTLMRVCSSLRSILTPCGQSFNMQSNNANIPYA